MSTKELPYPDLVLASGLLKRVKRAGWLKKAGITSDRESVADHSFRMAIIAMIVGLELQIDSAKLVRMCLIHDLAESVIGDKMPQEKVSFASHRRNEDKIMRAILGKLPEKSRSVLLRDWKELLDGNTREASLTWQIDKLEMMFQAKDYMRMGYERQKLLEFTKPKFEKRLIKMLETFDHSLWFP